MLSAALASLISRGPALLVRSARGRHDFAWSRPGHMSRKRMSSSLQARLLVESERNVEILDSGATCAFAKIVKSRGDHASPRVIVVVHKHLQMV
mmetsp:Transcript_10273/g.31482  ORF Transcript_10273/g.31482 Transcript_10273/m.31482 type:complete len:94 (-) Transcript_10273:925-1206(-)